jgi:hypothetical protein
VGSSVVRVFVTCEKKIFLKTHAAKRLQCQCHEVRTDNQTLISVKRSYEFQFVRDATAGITRNFCIQLKKNVFIYSETITHSRACGIHYNARQGLLLFSPGERHTDF